MPQRKRGRPAKPRIDPSTLPKPSMTVEEAAVYLRIGRARAYASITAGEIPVRRFGRVIRVYLKDLDEGRPGTPAKRPGLSVVR